MNNKLNEIAKEIDILLANETPENINQWLKERRENNISLIVESLKEEIKERTELVLEKNGMALKYNLSILIELSKKLLKKLEE